MSDKITKLEEEIEGFRFDLEKNQKRLDESSNLVFDILNTMHSDIHTYITFDDLRQFPLNKIQKFDSIEFKKVKENSNELVFLAKSKKGCFNNLQSHDCYEITTVLKGNLIEPCYGYKEYKEGDVIIYAPKENHSPYCYSNTVWRVVFRKTI